MLSEERKQRERDKYKKETEYTDLDQGKRGRAGKMVHPAQASQKKRWKSVGVRYENNCCSSQDTVLRKSG